MSPDPRRMNPTTRHDLVAIGTIVAVVILLTLLGLT